MVDNELEKIRREKYRQYLQDETKTSQSKFPSGKAVDVTDADFDEFVNQQRIVIVDCWAAWCGPCRSMSLVMEQIAKDMQEKVSVGKLNVDQNRRTAMRYNVSSIPNFLVFHNGKFLGNVVGAVGKAPFDKLIKQILSGEFEKKEGQA